MKKTFNHNTNTLTYFKERKVKKKGKPELPFKFSNVKDYARTKSVASSPATAILPVPEIVAT
jgi:hypothetical protein